MNTVNNQINISKIVKSVLNRLSKLDNEKYGGHSFEHLIFPSIFGENKEPISERVSEQELRLIFIEEFKKEYLDLFYSIETPTVEKYRFRDADDSGKRQSALHDMSIFQREISGEYNRILNLEFKHGNRDIDCVSKDIKKVSCGKL